MKRRKDLERTLPRAWRRSGDKVRVFEEDDSWPLFVVIGAAHRSETELMAIAQESLAMQRTAELMAAPTVGSMQ